MNCPTNTPLVRKLGIKAGHHVVVLEALAGFPALLAPLPEAVLIRQTAIPEEEADVDVIVLFVLAKSELQRRFAALARCLAQAGGLWVCWPKKTSGVATDLTEDVIRAVGLEVGLVDNKVCAIDTTWSALRFVIRIADRKKR